MTPGAGLLEQAAGYGLRSLDGIPPGRLAAATPCAGWDLTALLRHLLDSVTALHEAAELGCVDLVPPDAPVTAATGAGLADSVAAGVCRLLAGWGRAGRAAVLIEGRPIDAPVLAVVAALELAVHGWDVFAACGPSRPIPSGWPWR